MWKDTLRKMPMPMSVATGRDENYKQKIIAFEKKQIEPAFTKYTQGLGANVPIALVVKLSLNYESEFRERDVSGQSVGQYAIGTADIEKLGGDKGVILNTIKELYDKEGYTTQITGGELFIKNK